MRQLESFIEKGSTHQTCTPKFKLHLTIYKIRIIFRPYKNYSMELHVVEANYLNEAHGAILALIVRINLRKLTTD